MKDYMEGWKPVQNVDIPDLETVGFRKNIMIRTSVQPVCYRNEDKQQEIRREETVADVDGQNKNTEEPTVFLEAFGEDDDAEKTVLLGDRAIRAYVRRNSTEEEMEIHIDPFIIGKSSGCNFVVQDNKTVSRRHAQIKKIEGEYFLEDMNSSNHTFVNNEQIKDAMKLTDGMVFRCSDEEFMFRIEIG